MGAIVDEQVEHQRHQRRTAGLANQPGGAQHATGAATAVQGGSGNDGVIVGRLEQPEPGAAQHHPAEYCASSRLVRQCCQPPKTSGEQQHANTTQQARVKALQQPPSQRRANHGRQRPGRHQQTGLHGIESKLLLEIEGDGDHRQHLPGERGDRTADRQGKNGNAQQICLLPYNPMILKKELESLSRGDMSLPVVLYADGEVSHQSVVNIMSIIKNVGFEGLQLAIESETVLN